MITRIFIALALLVSFVAYSQEKLDFLEHYLPEKDKKSDEFHTYTSESDGNILIVTVDKRNVYAYLTDSNFKEISKGITVPFDARLQDIDGISGSRKEFAIYSSMQARKDWEVIYLDFNTGTFKQTEVDLRLKRANSVNHFIYDNTFNIVSLGNKSSLITIYKIAGDGSYTSQDFDLSDFDFGEGRRSISNLEGLIRTGSDYFSSNFVDSSTPLSLNSVNKPVKLYLENDLLRISVDQREDFLYVLDLDLLDGTSEVHKIIKPENTHYLSVSNSLIYDNKAFIFKSTSKDFVLSVVSVETGEILKEYRTETDQEIAIANTTIIQEGGTFDGYRELEKTGQFLRKVSNSSPAVSVFENNDKYILTIGASEKKDMANAIFAGAIIGGGVGMAIFAAINASTSSAFSDYANSKSARFKSVLDENLNHIQDASIPPNAFDDIKEYLKDNKVKINTSILKRKDDFILFLLNREEENPKFEAYIFDRIEN